MIVSILGGTGDQGPGMAMRWAKAGIEVIIGSRQQEKAVGVAAELNQELGQELIKGMANPEAAAASDIVAITVPFSAHKPTLESVKDHVQGKILIDVCVPLDPDNVRKMKYPEAGSATQEAQALLGDEVKVVAAFQNVSATELRHLEHDIDCDVLVCGNDRGARETVMELVEKMGMTPVDAGLAYNAPIVEGLTAVLIGLNIRNKVKGSGIRITGLP
ncbi:NADPH-dependent F420 reductase [Candidatus Entotheonella palauensis]|nr:NADPH-dependent F420 reductase [Candidatus Entotheonella palauensis]